MFEIIKGMWFLFLEFIGYLLDIEFIRDEKPLEEPFSNVSNAITAIEETKEKAFSPSKIFAPKEIALLESTFGRETAEYINSLRQQVEKLVADNTLEYVDSIYTVLPPEKFPGAAFSPAVIDNIIESVYSQFDGDIILKPGKINVFATENGLRYAEMYLDYYRPTEEFVMSR